MPPRFSLRKRTYFSHFVTRTSRRRHARAPSVKTATRVGHPPSPTRLPFSCKLIDGGGASPTFFKDIDRCGCALSRERGVELSVSCALFLLFVYITDPHLR